MKKNKGIRLGMPLKVIDVGQLAARIKMMSHHMRKPFETLSCPSDFHNTLLAPPHFSFQLPLLIKLTLITILKENQEIPRKFTSGRKNIFLANNSKHQCTIV